jgi:hypothetical protein
LVFGAADGLIWRIRARPFPEGSKIVKIVWKTRRNAEAPFSVKVQDIMDEVEFMEKG